MRIGLAVCNEPDEAHDSSETVFLGVCDVCFMDVLLQMLLFENAILAFLLSNGSQWFTVIATGCYYFLEGCC